MSAAVLISSDVEKEHAVRRALSATRTASATYRSAAAARQCLDGLSRRPWCVLLDGELDGAAELAAWMKGHSKLSSVPLVALVREVSDAAFEFAHRAGADDTVPFDDDAAIRRRVALLEAPVQSIRPAASAWAVVLGSDPSRRRVIGMYLRRAGYLTCFADAIEDLTSLPSDATVQVAVAVGCAEQLRSLVGRLRDVTRAPSLPVVAVVRPYAITSALDIPSVALVKDDAPTDHVLFQVNELLREQGGIERASRRVLFGTVCAFRGPGAQRVTYGLTYNVSAGGFYVRTLDAPARGTRLWCELAAPGAKPMHLRGDVAWRRRVCDPSSSSPYGFGLQLDDGDCPPRDLRAYRTLYADLLHHQARWPGIHEPASPAVALSAVGAP